MRITTGLMEHGPLVVKLAGALGAALVLVQAIRHYRLRTAAWPERLDDLTRPRPSSGPVRVVVGLLALVPPAGFVLWCAGGFAGRELPWAVFLAAALLAWACFMAAHWRYSAVLAAAGMSMVVLALTSWAMRLAGSHSPPGVYGRVLAAGVIALSFSAWLWIWLDRVWRQQRFDDGSAFTTAGRMVGLAARFGVWVSVLASLGVCVLIRYSLSVAEQGGWLATPGTPYLGTVALAVWLGALLLGPARERGAAYRLLVAAELAFPILAYAIR